MENSQERPMPGNGSYPQGHNPASQLAQALKKYQAIAASKQQIAAPRQKADCAAIQRWLRENGIQYLYHFTDVSNVPFIRQYGGLYSWHYLVTLGLHVPYFGGDALSRGLDSRRCLQDYVRLSFTDRHPMMFVARSQGRVPTPVILRIDAQVMTWEGALFADCNAASNGAVIRGDAGLLGTIYMGVIRKGTWSTLEEKAALQAEVLVSRHVPLKFIQGM